MINRPVSPRFTSLRPISRAMKPVSIPFITCSSHHNGICTDTNRWDTAPDAVRIKEQFVEFLREKIS